MASEPITGLPTATALVGTEPMAAVQGGITKQTTPNAIKDFIDASPTMTFKGQADASAVDEEAATGTSVFQNGDVYRINVADAAPHAFSDISEDLLIGDWVVFNGTIFQKQDGTDPTSTETKIAYESNPNTNAFTDSEKTLVASALQNVVEDTTPQFAANVDMQNNAVTDMSFYNMNVSVGAPSYSEGNVFWDGTDQTLAIQIGVDDVVLQVGQEIYIRVRNTTGSTITIGQAVYISGVTGNRPQITLARADAINTSDVIALATHDIENNSDGYVTTFGLVRGLDTNVFTEGDILYLSAATAGEWVSTAPAAPNVLSTIGRVTKSSVAQGVIFVDTVQFSPNRSIGNLRLHTTILPAVDDGLALGSATLAFSDLFLGSGSVINFNNGDVIITHSANVLTLTGGSLVTDISGGTITGITDLAIADGGTGASTAGDARINLGLGNLSTLNSVDTAQIDADAVIASKILLAYETGVRVTNEVGSGEITLWTLGDTRDAITSDVDLIIAGSNVEMDGWAIDEIANMGFWQNAKISFYGNGTAGNTKVDVFTSDPLITDDAGLLFLKNVRFSTTQFDGGKLIDVGHIDFDHTAPVGITFRNTGNTTDLIAINRDGSDNLLLGNSSFAGMIWQASFKMLNNTPINGRNFANDADISLIKVDASDKVIVGTRGIEADGTKLDGIEALADVTDTANVTAAGALMETDFNAQTILLAVVDDTPLPITIAASSFVGRKVTGDAGTMTPAEARTLLNVEDGSTADQTITLTGDVTGSGTGSFATTIATDAVDISMLSATGTPSSSTFLRGDNAWSVPSGAGDVVKVGTPIDNEISIWTGNGTIEGDANLTWNGSIFAIIGSLTISTDLAITEGGTGASSSGDARTNLGLVIGTDVQAEDPVLTDLAALSVIADNEMIVGTGAGTYANESGTTLRTSIGCKKVGKETLWVPATSMTPATTSGPATGQIETGTNKINVETLDFDKDADEFAHFNFALPKSWNLGTITFQVFWTAATGGTTGIAFALQGVAIGDNVTNDTAYGTAIIITDDAQTGANEIYVSAESAAVTIANTPADDEICFFRLFRDVSDANDDLAEDARLIGIKFFFTLDAEDDA